MSNPFEYIGSINQTKKDLIRTSENPELAEKQYSPFLVNRGLSYFPDTIMFANEMNMLPDLANIMQYEYLFHSVRKGKRFSKWSKPDKHQRLLDIAEYYQCSLVKASEISGVITDEQYSSIKELLSHGGVKR